MTDKGFICVLVLCLIVVAPVEATTYGNHVSGLRESFETANASQTEISNTQGIAFDPTHRAGGIYDRVYLANHSSTDTKRGLYSVDLINETSSGRLALGSHNKPTGVAVASDGTVYVSYDGTPAVYKVENASGSQTTTRILSNYGNTSADDDIGDIGVVKPGFGGGYAADSDIVLFDCGLDDDANSAVSVLDQSTGNITTLWDSGSTVNTIRGDTSSFDGYAYFVNYDMPTADSGGGVMRKYINRINGSGVLERIFLDIDPSEVTKIDSAVAINQADGSFWMAVNNGTHDVYRVDVANAVPQGGNDYLADITLEIGDLGYDVPNYSMAISPDGKLLAIGWDSGVDRMYVYDISTISPYMAWAEEFGLSGENAASTNDYDGDGLANLCEFGVGGDPTNSADRGISPSFIMEGGGGAIYVYPKRLDSGLTYFLELNTDLTLPENWTNSGYSIVGTGAIDSDFDAVTNQISTHGDKQFFRLMIGEIDTKIERIIASFEDAGDGNVLIAAHKGQHKTFPEDSTDAMLSAVSLGAQIVEMDVRKTKDNVFILMHDETIDRTTSGSGAVSNLTFAEIEAFYLYEPDGTTLSNLKVPSLEDVMLALKGECLMMLDKSYDYGFDEIAGLARSCGVENQVILKSSKTTSEMADVLNTNPDIYYGAGTISQGKYEDSIENLPLEMISISYSDTNSWLVSSAAQTLSNTYDVRVWNNSLDSTPNNSAGHIDSLALTDPDGNWGWQIEHGVDIIQTDEIPALRDYLISVGKYNN